MSGEPESSAEGTGHLVFFGALIRSPRTVGAIAAEFDLSRAADGPRM